jgi:predicted small metal-binding protein
MSKRVVECNVCGEPLAAATDEELLRQVRTHAEAEHKQEDFDEKLARAMISNEAYEAGDS